MRRLTAAFALLMASSLGLLAGTGAALMAGEDGLQVTAETVYGDGSAARGLFVEYGATAAGGRIGWDVSVGFEAEESEVKSVFVYRPDDEERLAEQYTALYTQAEAYFQPVEWYESVTVPAGVSNVRDLVSDAHAAIYTGVASLTDHGCRRTDTLRLSDYEAQFGWTLNARVGVSRFRLSLADGYKLKDCFQLDTEGYFIAVTVEKNASGAITSVESSLTEEAYLDNRSKAATDRRGVWLRPSVLDEDGEEQVRFRDGAGVYFIPAGGNGSEALDVDAMRPIYKSDGTPVHLTLREDGSVLELVERGGEAVTLIALDPLSGEVFKTLRLFEGGEPEVMTVTSDGELELLVLRDGRFALVEYVDGMPEFALSGVLDPEVISGVLPGSGSRLIFDGGRLAVCVENDGTCMVVDSAGIACIWKIRIPEAEFTEVRNVNFR